ncbi:sporulation membrane protein YtrI [Aquibacillus sediminis]|uniref:sporulation membrane protein YtrI n=1 Tax=Aquibacillus sediminis TaxID=2574734 RepID=UPI001109E5CC|nr:sporulation membrane protein YtrI [Aquibacillus sediminis]
MHIPPYYKKESWQRFFAGTFIGAILAFIIFVYMYGHFYERWVEENLTLRSELNTLRNNYEILEEDKKKLDQQSQQKITINEIEVSINNEKDLKLDSLIVHQLEEMIKEQIKSIIGEDIETIAQNSELVLSTIQNKTYKVDDFTYNASVRQLLLISESLNVKVELTLAN